ncbi:MAG: thiamine-phosphate kinase [Gammaproteobacteria bacterium]
MREREVISRFFNFPAASVDAGIGDDAAVLSPPPGARLAASCDTLNEGTHFFSGTDAYFVARKAAAASLSDMAATGARPLWMLVALTAPSGTAWLARFAEGLKSSAAEYEYAIVGGDLCRGDAISITVSVVGAVDGAPLLRGGARAGDDVWISGATGCAAFAAHCRKNNIAPPPQYAAEINAKLDDPVPRLALAQKLAGTASAAVDISDGLAAAAAAVAAQSKVKIIIQQSGVPVPPALSHLPEKLQNEFVLGGGDDYELLFCAPPSARPFLAAENAVCIGAACCGAGAEITGEDGAPVFVRGYEHDFGE